MKIFLIGMMGSGKTTIGKELAHRLGFEFADLDDIIIDMTGMSITNIFSKNGEEYFRDLESESIQILQANSTVIATGGGFPIRKRNKIFMEKNGISVYLQTNPKTILHRIQNESHRPLLKTMDLSTIQDILSKRTLDYETADHYISTDDKTIETICDEIIRRLKLHNA